MTTSVLPTPNEFALPSDHFLEAILNYESTLVNGKSLKLREAQRTCLLNFVKKAAESLKTDAVREGMLRARVEALETTYSNQKLKEEEAIARSIQAEPIIPQTETDGATLIDEILEPSDKFRRSPRSLVLQDYTPGPIAREEVESEISDMVGAMRENALRFRSTVQKDNAVLAKTAELQESNTSALRKAQTSANSLKRGSLGFFCILAMLMISFLIVLSLTPLIILRR